MHIIIMSGTSGSGKNTYIQKHYPTAAVVSADDFFEKSGVYVFDYNKLSEAHGECFLIFLTLLFNKNELIVVNNTNTSVIEMAPYVAAANAFKASLELITLIKDPVLCAERNVHGVPLKSIQNMLFKIKSRTIPKNWNFTSITEITTD